jgi:hypothetical protein
LDFELRFNEPEPCRDWFEGEVRNTVGSSAWQ